MVTTCPNKSHPDWKAIAGKYGDDVAWAAYITNGEVIPPIEYVDAHLQDIYPDASTANDEGQRQVGQRVRKAIEDHLTELGVGIGVLSAVDKANGIEGIYDPAVQRKVGSNLVELVKIAEGDAGARALPEEYAHVVIDSMTNKPLYNRLYHLLDDDTLLQAVLEREEEGAYTRYLRLHEGNRDLVIKEAMAKLVARHYLERFNAPPGEREKTLLERFLAQVSKLWSKIHHSRLANRLAEADEAYYRFAGQLVDGTAEVRINFHEIAQGQRLYMARASINKLQQLLVKIINAREQDLILRAKRAGKPNAKPGKRSNDLFDKFLKEDYYKGVSDGLQYLVEDLTHFFNNIQELRDAYRLGKIPARELATVVRDAMMLVSASKPIINDARDYLREQRGSEDQPAKEIKKTLTLLEEVIAEVETDYRATALPLLSSFYKAYLGGLLGKSLAGKLVTEETIEDWLNGDLKEISWVDRKLFAMAESSSTLLRLMAKPVARAHHNAEQRALKLVREMQKLQEDLEREDGGDTSFMYERDNEGKLTGYFLSRLNRGQYEKDCDKIDKEARESNGIPLDIDRNLLNAEYNSLITNKRRHPEELATSELFKKLHAIPDSNLRAWGRQYHNAVNAITVYDGPQGFIPSPAIYTNPAFAAMNARQRAYRDKIMDIKADLDNLLPRNGGQRAMLLAPQTHATLTQQLRTADDITDAVKKIGRRVKDKWTILEEESDMGGGIEALNNIDGTRAWFLPVRYKRKLADMNALDTDVTSAMSKYAIMAINYDEMSNIVDILELTRQYMKEFSTVAAAEPPPRGGVYTRLRKLISGGQVKSASQSELFRRMDSFFDMQVYGQTQKQERVAGIDATKLGNNIMQLAALNSYALNALAGISNVVTGTIMGRIESIAAEFFSTSDTTWADKQYALSLPSVMEDLGRRRPRSKFNLVMEKFNAFQDHDKMLKGLRANQKNILSRAFRLSSLFFISNCGEHYLQSRTILALAHRVKLKDSGGAEITLWDALEVVKDDKGIEELRLKPGVTTPDGSPVNEEFFFDFSQRAKRLNQKMHGIYNREDMADAQQYVLGRMVFMFRKWVLPFWNRRYQAANYDFGLDQETEGFYRSGARLLYMMWKDLKEGQFHLAANYAGMSDHERANVRRSLAELGQLLTIILAYAFLFSDDDNNEDSYGRTLLKYQLRRLRTEVGAMAPTPMIIQEWYKIFSSPSAVLDYTMNTMTAVFDFGEIGRKVPSGPFKDYDAYLRNWIRVLPLVNPVRKMLSPDEAIKYFNFRK
jgi:hypothetical protein